MRWDRRMVSIPDCPRRQWQLGPMPRVGSSLPLHFPCRRQGRWFTGSSGGWEVGGQAPTPCRARPGCAHASRWFRSAGWCHSRDRCRRGCRSPDRCTSATHTSSRSSRQHLLECIYLSLGQGKMDEQSRPVVTTDDRDLAGGRVVLHVPRPGGDATHAPRPLWCQRT